MYAKIVLMCTCVKSVMGRIWIRRDIMRIGRIINLHF